DASWQQFFAGNYANEAASRAVTRPSWSHNVPKFEEDIEPGVKPDGRKAGKAAASGTGAVALSDIEQATRDTINALMLIRNYRVRGHIIANYDPLELDQRPSSHSDVDPATYGFEPKDYDRKIFLDGVLGMKFATIREILEILNATYCSHIGVEF